MKKPWIFNFLWRDEDWFPNNFSQWSKTLILKFLNFSASEDDEDEAALLREFVKVKKEREEAEKRKEELKAKEQEEKDNEELLNDNPLYKEEQPVDEGVYLKRKWYDETVFKNQARIQQKPKKRFINDTVRSDFHKDFLNRFIH